MFVIAEPSTVATISASRASTLTNGMQIANIAQSRTLKMFINNYLSLDYENLSISMGIPNKLVLPNSIDNTSVK
jgi:hypothetical protein